MERRVNGTGFMVVVAQNNELLAATGCLQYVVVIAVCSCVEREWELDPMLLIDALLVLCHSFPRMPLDHSSGWQMQPNMVVIQENHIVLLLYTGITVYSTVNANPHYINTQHMLDLVKYRTCTEIHACTIAA